MEKKQISKIVYLFGAGATHAELVNLYPDKINDPLFNNNRGLLMKYVSERVIKRAMEEEIIKTREIKRLLSPVGLSNIELFISLIDKNQVKSEKVIDNLKKAVRQDIEAILTKPLKRRFYLHRSLLELHSMLEPRETLTGIISLNYDSVLDEAYDDLELIPDRGLGSTSGREEGKTPLLKLHGGFNLRYAGRSLQIITPSVNKNYLELPYNFAWGRALEILIECNQLRIIGCSLSQNDIGLIDLLFKAHIARRKDKDPFEIQMITYDRDFQADGTSSYEMRKSYGFLPNFKTAMELENRLISDGGMRDPTKDGNPFKIWLRAKIERAITEKIITDMDIRKTRYVKKILV